MMRDLLDFEGQDLYFDASQPPEVSHLINLAANRYGDGEAELPLLRAYLLSPNSLAVLVALYRFYYYQHRLQDALTVADRAMACAGGRLGFPEDWKRLGQSHIDAGAARDMGLVRFYLFTLKAAGFVNLRLGKTEESRHMLQKLVDLDPLDRLGGASLLAFVRKHESGSTEHPLDGNPNGAVLES